MTRISICCLIKSMIFHFQSQHVNTNTLYEHNFVLVSFSNQNKVGMVEGLNEFTWLFCFLTNFFAPQVFASFPECRQDTQIGLWNILNTNLQHMHRCHLTNCQEFHSGCIPMQMLLRGTKHGNAMIDCNWRNNYVSVNIFRWNNEADGRGHSFTMYHKPINIGKPIWIQLTEYR